MDTLTQSLRDITVTSYLLVMALAAYLAYKRFPHRQNPRYRRWMVFHGAVALLMFLLAVNRHLGLDSMLVHKIRLMTRQEGWYAARRAVQQGTIIIILLLGALALFGFARLTNRVSLLLFLSGLVFLLCFIFIRSISYHAVDSLLGFYEGARWRNWFLEMGGIVATAAGLMWHFVSDKNR